jgi:hypothetical protein
VSRKSQGFGPVFLTTVRGSATREFALAHFHVADHPLQLILIMARFEMSSPSLRLTSISLRASIQFEGLLLRAFFRMSRLQGGRVTGWR